MNLEEISFGVAGASVLGELGAVSVSRVLRQAGKRAQPQNLLPAFFPFRDVRKTISAPHSGHSGAAKPRTFLKIAILQSNTG